jgi:Aspartyl protease
MHYMHTTQKMRSLAVLRSVMYMNARSDSVIATVHYAHLHCCKQAIQRSYEQAMEDTPEVFGRVTMLYIDTVVNNTHSVKAFVDSGAQVSTLVVHAILSLLLPCYTC